MRWLQWSPEVLVVTVMLLAAPTHGAAQDAPGADESLAADVMRCGEIESSYDRLSCFDRIAEEVSPAVSREDVYAAPWLIGIGSEPEHTGVVDGFGNSGVLRESAFGPDDVARVSMPVPARVGTDLQAFRIEGTIEGVGEVVVPTGVLRVATILGDGIGAIVVSTSGRMQRDDLVRPAPPYGLQPGVHARDISGGSEAMIMGYARGQAVGIEGDVLFLDLGSADGLAIGDELAVFGAVLPTDVIGLLRVIGVTPTWAAARIVSLDGGELRQGSIARLTRKMP